MEENRAEAVSVCVGGGGEREREYSYVRVCVCGVRSEWWKVQHTRKRLPKHFSFCYSYVG